MLFHILGIVWIVWVTCSDVRGRCGGILDETDMGVLRVHTRVVCASISTRRNALVRVKVCMVRGLVTVAHARLHAITHRTWREKGCSRTLSPQSCPQNQERVGGEQITSGM